MTRRAEKNRLDLLLLEQGLAPTRQRAQALIMAGKVFVDGVRAEKPGREFSVNAQVTVKGDLPYVSRGGLKLEAALDRFGVDPSGLTVLDAGASTGGFSDCLLKRGAAHVVAVDVGYGQFHWSLRNDSRVTLLERTNIRLMNPDGLPRPVDAAVADLSFISLKLVFPQLHALLPPGGWLIPLVKPQFEVGKGEVGRGGVVRDPEKLRAAVELVSQYAGQSGFRVTSEMESPILGPKGNREFLLHLIRSE